MSINIREKPPKSAHNSLKTLQSHIGPLAIVALVVADGQKWGVRTQNRDFHRWEMAWGRRTYGRRDVKDHLQGYVVASNSKSCEK